jgi:hypothetical protein
MFIGDSQGQGVKLYEIAKKKSTERTRERVARIRA